jgi:plastocyanin
MVAAACRPDPEFRPDETLQAELGLTERDEVHTVTITGGEVEHSEPSVTTVSPGVFVQFVTTDWLVHEVIFEADSMLAEALDFMTLNDQMVSPPLMHKDSRFVVSFLDAPAGRYPFRLEGNGGSARGAVIVTDPEGSKR